MKNIAITAFALSWLVWPAAAQTSSPEDRLARSRAVEAVIWGMPAVDYDLMWNRQCDSRTTVLR
jgi:hypothetical protein